MYGAAVFFRDLDVGPIIKVDQYELQKTLRGSDDGIPGKLKELFKNLRDTYSNFQTSGSFMITVYGDVMKDTKFFTETFPWIIDNVGGHLGVDYYLLGSGRYSVPQMCALEQLQSNTFLQAQYLKCEAEGKKSEVCLCSCGIDSQRYRQCVLDRGFLAGKASEKYAQLKLDASPIVELWPKNTVFEVSDMWYLKKICTIFGEEDGIPHGCTNPSDRNNSTTEFLGKKTVVEFFCYKFDYSETEHANSTTLVPEEN